MELDRIKRKLDDLCVAKSMEVTFDSFKVLVSKIGDDNYELKSEERHLANNLPYDQIVLFFDVQLIKNKCINISMDFS